MNTIQGNSFSRGKKTDKCDYLQLYKIFKVGLKKYTKYKPLIKNKYLQSTWSTNEYINKS